MNQRQTRWIERLIWPAAVGAIYGALAALTFWLTGNSQGIAALWPCSGVYLAALLVAPEALRPRVIVAVALGSLAANLGSGQSLWIASGFTFANVTEGLFAARLTQRNGRFGSFAETGSVRRFGLAAVAAGLYSAVLASVVAVDVSGALFASWFTTTVLGMLIVTPLIVTVVRAIQARRTRPGQPRLAGDLAAIGAVVVVSLIVFFRSPYPLLFVPVAAMMLATYRAGPLGAAASVFVIAAVGSAATAFGQGPIHAIVANARGEVLALQFYLLTLLAAALPIAALLAQRETMVASLRRSAHLMAMAERSAGLGHWHYDLVERRLTLSDEIYRLYGLPIGASFRPTAELSPFHPEDRGMLREALRRIRRTGRPETLETRLCRPDGEVRHVSHRVAAETGPGGEAIALFGVMQDVTERIASLAELESARQRAEREARAALALSETDQLTGIANRRKALAILDNEVARAESKRTPLAIGLLDVDHFKMINDGFGHAAGDEVLKRIATTCAAAVRASDFVGRIGGEEFVLVLPGATSAEASEVAERVRSLIEGLEWAPLGVARITASIGVAAFAPGMDTSRLLQSADRALYRAKAAGRNRLSVDA